MKRFLSLITIKHIKAYVHAHRWTSLFVFCAVLGLGYWGIRAVTNTNRETRYVTALVERGTLVTSITGSGQVSASNQVDLKPKVSGDVVYIGVQNGQEVHAGALIAQLNARDAQKAVRDAEANLASAKLSLEKLQKPADTLSLIQAENTLARAKESKQNAEDALQKGYEDGFNTVSNAFIDIPGIVTGLQDLLYLSTVSGASGLWNINYYSSIAAQYNDKATMFRDDADTKYRSTRDAYDKNFLTYKQTNRTSDRAIIEALIIETYETTRSTAEAVKSATNLIQLYQDNLSEHSLTPASLSNTHISTLNSYTTKLNAHLLGLLSIKNTIQNNKNALINAERTISETDASLTKLKNGADTLDIQGSELSVKQRENALLDARERLVDYFIYAPFAGTIAKLNVKRADSVTNGTIAATLITTQKIAEISLNEVDVSKIKVGQKTTLTFDAISGLSIAGSVVEVDTIGTVSQGVVTYNVKIGFDTQDDRIKPGMSVSAAIITDIKQDVLMVLQSAVRSRGSSYYVEMFNPPLVATGGIQGTTSSLTPQQRSVEVGISNDTSYEVISGLKEGDQIISRTITATTKTQTTTQAPSLFGAPGGNRGGGGGGAGRGR
ncbi:MAG: HlyD family efflux transporter periplasmic adaptor subunit [Parcubacteria group bacterium]|nr:HlyD family efflux transporter periplasmic adaptor subunit [Parcubacteria group bacterium]